MTLIYTSTKSKVKPKNTAKKKQLAADWEALLRKWNVSSTNPSTTIKNSERPKSNKSSVRTSIFDSAPSISTGVGVAPKKQPQQYTGDQCIGIATLHKSNGVPVFKQQDAEDIAKMRR